jgi:hypothetical protein
VQKFSSVFPFVVSIFTFQDIHENSLSVVYMKVLMSQNESDDDVGCIPFGNLGDSFSAVQIGTVQQVAYWSC